MRGRGKKDGQVNCWEGGFLFNGWLKIKSSGNEEVRGGRAGLDAGTTDLFFSRPWGESFILRLAEQPRVGIFNDQTLHREDRILFEVFLVDKATDAACPPARR